MQEEEEEEEEDEETEDDATDRMRNELEEVYDNDTNRLAAVQVSDLPVTVLLGFIQELSFVGKTGRDIDPSP
jgi:hypothetical protein